MAGHSKWANTKHRKAAQDAKRGKIFTKIIRELVTAARLGGGDAGSNPRLRAAIDKALSNNMTRDTLNRAIARGVGGDDDANMETIIYEGYGPGGTAVMVECLSDNRNRTVAEVRHAFTKTGGNLGTDGSVSYLFSKKGVISFEKGDEDAIMEAALEACRLRLRPIVMTSIAFIAGTIPLILGHGAGAEVRGVTGITVFSGMLGVTLFGLFLTPVFYVTLRKFVTRGKAVKDVSPA